MYKKLISLIIIVFFIIGCSQQSITVKKTTISKPKVVNYNRSRFRVAKPKYTIGKPILKPQFSTVDYSDPNFKITKPFIQLGHSQHVDALAITPDGKYVLSGAADGRLILWDIKTGKEIRTFIGHTSFIRSIAITPDGKYILSGSEDRTLKLWDIKTAKEIKTFTGHKREISTVIITSDGKYVFSGGSIKVKLWNIKTGKEIRVFKLDSGVHSLAITADDKYLLVGTTKGKIYLFDIETGKMLRTLIGHSSIVSSIVTTPDGKYAVSGSWDKTIKLWNIKTGKEIKIFKEKLSLIYSLAIVSDGKYVISGGRDGLILWEISTGKKIKIINDKSWVSSIVITPDGTQILSHDYGGKTVELLDANTGKRIRKFKGNPSSVTSVAITSNGRYVIVSDKYNNRLKLWDINKAKEIKSFKWRSNIVRSLSISSDGRYALLNYWNNTQKLLNIETGKETKSTNGHLDRVNALLITSDEKYFLTASADKTIKLWDIKTGKEIKTFKGHIKRIWSLDIDPKGEYIISGAFDGLKLWNIKTGKEIRTINRLKLNSYSATSIAITPNGKYILVSAFDNSARLLDINTGKEIRAFKGYYDELISPSVYSVAITPDGRYALSGSADKTIRLWDIKTAKNLKTFTGHTGSVDSIAISQDGKYIVSGSSDGTVKYWDIKTGKELLTMVSFSDGEWVSITTEGYFNASKNGAKHLNILTGPMQVSSIDQYYETFYRPDIVASVMSGSKDKYASPRPTLKISDVKPAPEVAIINTKESINKEELKVTLKITPSSGGVGQIRLYLDGVLIKTDGDRGLQKKKSKNSVLKTYTIKLPKGKHTIKAIVYNEANTMASQADTLVVVSNYNPIVKPNIYAVVIGINEYKNPAIALKYAVADAELFAKTIKAKTKGLYGDVKLQLLTTKKQTSKDNITKILKEMKNISPNDLFIFFVASHGMIEEAKYHMITSNVGALSSRGIKKEAISQESLRNMLANIPTTKKFIILDTCNSGALGKSIEVELLTRGLTEVTAMKVLSRAVGSTIISASSSSQEALEGYKGHGLLTYVLADGLNGKADSDNDGYIKTLEIANFVEDIVPEIAEKEFNRAQYPFISPLGHGFPLVKVK